MSLIQAAVNNVTRYGYKGAAKLTPVTGKTEDLELSTVTPTFGQQVELLSYVRDFDDDQINNTSIFAGDINILAVPDADWDGLITKGDKVTIDLIDYDVIRVKTRKVGTVIALVEIQVRGQLEPERFIVN